MVFFQFIDDDFERGMQTKKEIEKVFNIAQIVMYVLLFILIYVLSSTTWEHRYLLAFVILFLFSTRFFNPIGATYKLYKGQKQSIFKEGPSNDTEDDLEPFDNP
jgi:NhaP-type Na+/H+ or K+/H+ antiporter